MPFSLAHLLPAAAALTLSLALTPLVRAFARRFDVIARPRTDRHSRRPTAMMGGVAIFLSVLTAFVLFVPHTREGWVVMGASTALFVVGLVDDFLHIKPYQKLIGQVLGAAFVVYYGLTLPWTSSILVNMALAIFWSTEMPPASPAGSQHPPWVVPGKRSTLVSMKPMPRM